MKKILIAITFSFLFQFAFTLQIFSQDKSAKQLQTETRTKISINRDWKFSAENKRGSESVGLDDSEWASLNLPHTWNAEDAFDETPGYRQGPSWYRKKIKINGQLAGKRLFVYFEGVGQVADVFVNGRFAGNHIGGYTAFVFDITDFIIRTAPDFENIIAVRVNNQPTDNIPPSATADFNFYGGIYRDVYLIAVNPVHISLTDYASSGIYIDTPLVSDEKASVRIRGKIINDSQAPQKLKVKNTIFNKENVKVGETESNIEIDPQKELNFEQMITELKKPNLWSPESPYLYNVSTEIYDADNRLIDAVKNPLGFRWFNFDAEKGFFLNGKPLKLVGGNRHQDYQGLGNALPNEIHEKDLEIIKKSGMNWVLLAHYPHDPAVLEAADRLGLIVWEEAPILRQISTSPLYTKTAVQMLTEMIRQHYNHPSLVFWCYMNEIFLRIKKEKDYVPKTVELARLLEETAKREDPNRLTVISFNRPYTANDVNEESGLTAIPDVVAWHFYFGWYYGQLEDLGGFLDDYHRRFPQRRLLISEYGADSDSRIHSVNPKMKDYSTEWAQNHHEKYVGQMISRPYLGGFAVWNTFDFGSETRGESVPHVNKKGIYKFDREPKDIAYFYQAKFTPVPVLHIAAREWRKRAEFFSNKQEKDTKQPIKIYTNLPEVELFLNGKSLGKKQIGDAGTIVWEANLQRGINRLEARGLKDGKVFADKAEIDFVAHRKNKDGNQLAIDELAVEVGSEAEYLDDQGTLWEADRAYTTGDWGFVGQSETADKRIELNILNTSDDPLYQTFRTGFSGYRFDVTDGEYEIELRFAEPFIGKVGERVFNVSANGKSLLENFDLRGESTPLSAISKTFKIRVNGGKGLSLDFTAATGKTILSALRLRRLVSK
ncbi:MAG: DUF4982 domain-containing protein [Pyrinomonadaceae bacterium]|nr:DUF4982 domain-containing protein [Pyrinomonadaceae bacterium]